MAERPQWTPTMAFMHTLAITLFGARGLRRRPRSEALACIYQAAHLPPPSAHLMILAPPSITTLSSFLSSFFLFFSSLYQQTLPQQQGLELWFVFSTSTQRSTHFDFRQISSFTQRYPTNKYQHHDAFYFNHRRCAGALRCHLGPYDHGQPSAIRQRHHRQLSPHVQQLPLQAQRKPCHFLLDQWPIQHGRRRRVSQDVLHWLRCSRWWFLPGRPVHRHAALYHHPLVCHPVHRGRLPFQGRFQPQ